LRAIAGRPILLVVALALFATACHSDSGSTAAPSPSLPTTLVPATAARNTTAPPVRTPRPRVLLIGDSILDQEGSAAAFELRQAGVDAQAVAVWGSGIIGIDAYDRGVTKPTGYWLHRAKQLIAAFDPEVVGVYMNHSYWPPYPHDAAGNPITDLSSSAGQAMIGKQARALIAILRARGARVFFITPAPVATTGDPDPAASNPIWRGYLPALRARHVLIADSARALKNPAGLRAETETSCTGAQERVRPPGDVHLTRFGAGLAGTALAQFVANLVLTNLHANTAPGADVAALVPTRTGRGYWLVACDGSVFHFGDAASLPGAGSRIARHGGAVTAVGAPSGSGLWVVAADGTLTAVGSAPALVLRSHPSGPIVAATAAPGGAGLWAVTAAGAVFTAGTAVAYPGAAVAGPAAGPAARPVVGIAPTPDGRGYWLANRAGEVFAFGDARGRVPPAARLGAAPVAGIAATVDGHGYWLVGTDGSVIPRGDARSYPSAIWRAPTGPRASDTAAPGPTVGIVATRSGAGYWVFGTTGRIVNRGSAPGYGGDNNLALATQ
jgi:hypothetical protein